MASYFREAIAQRGVGSPWEDMIQDAAAAYRVPLELVKGVISAESAWNPRAVSSTRSSFGLLQLNVRAQAITEAQAFDPAFAIPFGTRVLATQLGRLPSAELALAAYNAGTSRSAQDLGNRLAGDVNGVATYVQTVLEYAAWFRGNDPTIAGAAGGTPAPDILRGPYDAPPAPAANGAPPADASANVSPWPFPAEISPAPLEAASPSFPSLPAFEQGAGEWGPWLLVGLGALVVGWWVLSPQRGR